MNGADVWNIVKGLHFIPQTSCNLRVDSTDDPAARSGSLRAEVWPLGYSALTASSFNETLTEPILQQFSPLVSCLDDPNFSRGQIVTHFQLGLDNISALNL